MTFLDFVRARDFAWRARQDGAPQPWCIDPIVATHKFTNVFRVLDYGSQFVLTNLIDPGLEPAEQLARLFLYRHTGRVEAWQYLDVAMGRYLVLEDLDDIRETWQQYRGEARPNWSGSTTPGGQGGWGRLFKNRIFTSAYMVFPQSIEKGTDKLDSIIELTRQLFTSPMPKDFLTATTQYQRFRALRGNKGVADFMSMQILTDWGYTTEFREDDFIVPGPGARKGAAALGIRDATAAVQWAVTAIRAMPDAPTLDGRPVSWMDAQNCLCEFSKYVRYQQKPVPRKPYQPAHPGPLPYRLPEHW